MFLKNTCVCLVTINTPSTSVFRFTKGKDDKTEHVDVETVQGAKPKVPKGYSIEQAKEIRQISGKAFDLKPAGAAIEISDEICAIPVVLEQIKKYTSLRKIEKVESASEYSAMSREDLEGVAAAYGLGIEKEMTDDQLIDAINAVENT